ncbi:YxiG family protein [Niallia sp. 03133]|uniref:YxiG family protein n=1 Tax=Niallia sp. 03133 TaxID=3458060 RepID=UPI004044CDB6
MLNKIEFAEEINSLFVQNAEFWKIIDLQISYLNESIILKLVSIENEVIKITNIQFNQVLSFYLNQEAEIETYRLNNYEDNDDLLLTEISYHPNGFGQIYIKTLEPELKEIESLTAPTNFYFQVNNKDCFFIEANSILINGKSYNNLIEDEKVLKNPY